MSEPKLHEWEDVARDTFRLRVPGGWIYMDCKDMVKAWAVFVPTPPDPPRPGE